MVLPGVRCRDLSSGLAYAWQNKYPALLKLSNMIFFFINQFGITH